MQSDYMHWAKFKPPVRYPLTGSEVPHFRMDLLPIDHRRPRARWREPSALPAAARGDRRPLRRRARAGRRRRRHVDGELPRDGGADRARRRSADRASDLRAAARRRELPRRRHQAFRAQAGGRIPARSGGGRSRDDRTQPPDRPHQPAQPERRPCRRDGACAPSASSPRASARTCWSTRSISTPQSRRAEAPSISAPSSSAPTA